MSEAPPVANEVGQTPEPNPWLERPWFWANNDGRICVHNSRVVILEVAPAQAPGVIPRRSSVKDKEEIATLICRAVNGEQRKDGE